MEHIQDLDLISKVILQKQTNLADKSTWHWLQTPKGLHGMHLKLQGGSNDFLKKQFSPAYQP